MTDATTAEAVISFTESKALAYKEKYGKLPASIVFDSVSCIYDSFYDSCNRRFTGFTIYSQLDREIKQFADFLEELLANGINIVILSHALYDSETSKHNLVGKGSFAKRGGFSFLLWRNPFLSQQKTTNVYYTSVLQSTLHVHYWKICRIPSLLKTSICKTISPSYHSSQT